MSDSQQTDINASRDQQSAKPNKYDFQAQLKLKVQIPLNLGQVLLQCSLLNASEEQMDTQRSGKVQLLWSSTFTKRKKRPLLQHNGVFAVSTFPSLWKH